MLKSYCIVNIPDFKPNYKKEIAYGYKGTRKDNLSKLLYETTNGYCMYCYSKILVDSKNFGHLEHSIEKFHSKEKLINCVPNIGLACPTCNGSFKSKGEKEFSFDKMDIDEFNNCTCNPSSCRKECKYYKKIKRKYLKKRKIILQPMGVSVSKRDYKIQYNLLNLEFEPSREFDYTDNDIEFVKKHIQRFNLNDGRYRTRELLKFCKDYVNGKMKLDKGKYDNFIVDLFIDLLFDMSHDERIKLCNIVYCIGKLKGLS